MAKLKDDKNMATRETRSTLAHRQDMYWHEFEKNCYLGYYKGSEIRVWTVRFDGGGGQLEERLALADDLEDADGVRVMDFEQARAAARNWCASKVISEARQPVDDRPFMSAGPACNRN